MQLVQHLLILERVHADPEAIVFVGREVSFLRQPLEGFVEQVFALVNVGENVLLEDEIAAVDANLGFTYVCQVLDEVVLVR